MITAHLIRHGQTIWHAENRYAGSSDIPLTDEGRRQAAALAPWARRVGLEVVASSDLGRAVETAAPMVAASGASHVIDARLREVDFGRGEGMTRHEMDGLFPNALQAFLAAPASTPLPSGESGRTAAARGLAGLAELITSHPDGVIAVVAHSTLIRLVLCELLGLPLDDYRSRFPITTNASVTTLRLPRVRSAEQLRGHGALITFNAPVA